MEDGNAHAARQYQSGALNNVVFDDNAAGGECGVGRHVEVANLHAAGAKVADERVLHATVGASGAEPETVVAGVLHLTPFKADVLGKVEVHGGGDACRCLFAVFTPLGHHIG